MQNFSSRWYFGEHGLWLNFLLKQTTESPCKQLILQLVTRTEQNIPRKRIGTSAVHYFYK